MWVTTCAGKNSRYTCNLFRMSFPSRFIIPSCCITFFKHGGSRGSQSIFHFFRSSSRFLFFSWLENFFISIGIGMLWIWFPFCSLWIFSEFSFAWIFFLLNGQSEWRGQKCVIDPHDEHFSLFFLCFRGGFSIGTDIIFWSVRKPPEKRKGNISKKKLVFWVELKEILFKNFFDFIQYSDWHPGLNVREISSFLVAASFFTKFIFKTVFPTCKWYAFPAHHTLVHFFYNLYKCWKRNLVTVLALDTSAPRSLVLQHLRLLCSVVIPTILNYGQAIKSLPSTVFLVL